MNARALVSLPLLLGTPSARAQEENAARTYDYDFAWDIAPRLVQAGCATAECHGGATGRGGFKLSLFGTDPRADHAAIVEELDGRRIDRIDPERSLILRKPTLALEHGGGLRWDDDDEAVGVLRAWIAAGAPYRASTLFEPVELELRLRSDVMHGGLSVQLHAIDARGERRWALDRASLTTEDGKPLPIDELGYLSGAAPAPAFWIFARLGQLDARLRVSSGERRTGEERVAPRADPHTLARRLSFDLRGRWPSAEELRRHLARPAETRLEELARELLEGPEFAAQFARFVARWLGREEDAATVRSSTLLPLDRLAREALREGGLSALLRRRSDPRDRMEHFAGAFLGLRLECARCHNHPADRWRQGDHLAFSALFVEPRPDGAPGLFFDPANGARIAPRFLGARTDAGAAAFEPGALAEWLLTEQRERFAENAANRLAAFLLGEGLVEPLDDHRTTNPPRDEALLEELRERLLAAHFDPRPVLRWLASSELYQRASAPSTATGAREDVLRAPRVLGQRELLRALAAALDAPLPTEGITEAPLARELELLHGEAIDALLTAPGNLLDGLAAFEPSDDAALEELFLALLTRPPRAEERALLLPRFASGTARLVVLREIARALILTREIGAHR